MSSEVETSRDISEFAGNDRRGDTTLCLFSSLHVYHDNSAHSAALNMAIDEALLEHATVPSIRFYRWHSPALSFGYFGRFADVKSYTRENDLVRRWTGGGIVSHGDDLTYSIVIPASDPAFAESSVSIYETIHRALRNALIAPLTAAGAIFAGLITGAVILENVFAWPGVGRLLVTAVSGRDFPVVQGITVMVAVMVLVINLLVDIAYAYVDPRIRF